MKTLAISALTVSVAGYVGLMTIGMDWISRGWPKHYCPPGNVLPCDVILATESLPRGVRKLTADGKLKPEFGGEPWPTPWAIKGSAQAD